MTNDTPEQADGNWDEIVENATSRADDALSMIDIVAPAFDTTRTELVLAQARKFKRLKVEPLVSYRCHYGDLLVEAWNTPAGIVWHAPSFRVSAARGASIPGQYLLHGASAKELESGALVSGERAGILDSRPVALLCRHVAEDHAITADALKKGVLDAQANGTNTTVLLSSPA